jgi:hypothetical protein
MSESNLNLISKFCFLITNKIPDSLKLPLILKVLIDLKPNYSSFILESNESKISFTNF